MGEEFQPPVDRRSRVAGNRSLKITLSPDLQAPDAEQNLLVAFRFSSRPVKEMREQVVCPGPALIIGEDRYECWWFSGEVDHRSVGDIRVAECDDYAFVVLQRKDVSPGRFRDHTYTAYRDLLDVINEAGLGHLVRIWNYFPNINAGEGDTEKYRQFSIGRAEAFEEAGIFDVIKPAGTAVGTFAGGLTIIALVSKSAFLPTENPRQVSAYNYPRNYGPRSPQFSRGGCVANQDHDLFIISGTAAIIGHESRHPDNTQLQIEETIENLRHLTRAMSSATGTGSQFEIDSSSMLRVYVRNREDVGLVADSLQRQFGSVESNVLFVQADICRRELTVEIDGVRCV